MKTTLKQEILKFYVVTKRSFTGNLLDQLLSAMGLLALQNCCVSRSMDYLESYFEPSIPGFSVFHCSNLFLEE